MCKVEHLKLPDPKYCRRIQKLKMRHLSEKMRKNHITVYDMINSVTFHVWMENPTVHGARMNAVHTSLTFTVKNAEYICVFNMNETVSKTSMYWILVNNVICHHK